MKDAVDFYSSDFDDEKEEDRKSLYKDSKKIMSDLKAKMLKMISAPTKNVAKKTVVNNKMVEKRQFIKETKKVAFKMFRIYFKVCLFFFSVFYYYHFQFFIYKDDIGRLLFSKGQYSTENVK